MRNIMIASTVTPRPHYLPEWLFTFLKFLGRFPYQGNCCDGGCPRKISYFGLLPSLLFTALCILSTQPMCLLLETAFCNPRVHASTLTKIGLIVICIHCMSSYAIYFAWYFALPSLLRCSQKLAIYDGNTHWISYTGKRSYVAAFKSKGFWALLTCAGLIAVLIGKSQWDMAKKPVGLEKFWLRIVSSDDEVVMYIIEIGGFYMEFIKSVACVLFYILGYALNDRIQLLTRSVENEGLSQVYSIKAIATSCEGLSAARVRRLRELLLNLLAIHQEFSSASEFLLLVQTVNATVLTCFSVYVVYYTASISKLQGWHGDMRDAYSSVALLVMITDLLILGNCGEVLGRNVWNCLKTFCM